MSTSTILKKEYGSDFNSVCSDAYKDLSAGRTAYVFSYDQVKVIFELVNDYHKKSKCSFSSKDISVKEDGGFYYLTNTNRKKRGNK